MAEIYIPGTPIPDKHVVVARSGWEIPCEDLPLDMKPLTPKDVEIKASVWKNRLPEIQIRSISSHEYNCVGMIFASRRAMIQIQYVEKILLEDGYRRILPRDVMCGDIVLYRNGANQPAHVGVILSRIGTIGSHHDFLVLSKWGLDAEFLHPSARVPTAYGIPSEFYTERVEPTGQYHELR